MERYNEDIYQTMKKWRTALNEAKGADEKPEELGDSVPYTMQDEVMKSITETCRQQFGADFSQSKTPMLYYPKDKNVSLSGVIGSLNDVKFHFVLKDDHGGCYLWSNPVILTDKTVKILNVIYGVYQNWQKEMTNMEDYKPMSLQNENEGEDYVPSIPNGIV